MTDNLSIFLRAGGMLVVDSSEAEQDGPFMQSVKRELGRILPNRDVQQIPRSHVLYKSFYLIPKPGGRVITAPYMDAVFGENRAMVLISYNDMMGAWARDKFGQFEYDVFPGGERQREMAYRLGINIVMYALCLNYKEDQVHVPFILRRRKWRID